MTSASAAPKALASTSGPSLRTRIAAIVVVAALAGLAAYAMFSGPTTVPAPPASGPTKSAAPKAAPQNEDQFPEGKEGNDRG